MEPKDNINQFLNPEGSLSQQVIQGGFWVFALRITERLLDIIRLIILVRLLAPNDFGLLGIALLAISILGIFFQSGFESALIQKKEKTEQYLNTAWTVLVVRGIVLFCILFAAAPLAGTFFNAPEAVTVVRVLAFITLLYGFRNIGVVYFIKELKFNKQFIYSFVSTVADAVVAVSCAFILRNVWALVFGLLARNMVQVIASYVIHPFRPKINIDWTKAKELFSFGKWVLAESILGFLITQGDDIFVSKLLGAAALGFYQLSFRISYLPVREIALVISQVSYPALSKLQDQIANLRTGYLKILRVNNFVTIPVAILLFFFSYDFTHLILGEKWLSIAPLLRIFCITVVLASVNASTGSLFYAVGKPFINVRSQTIKMVAMFSVIYPLMVRLGIAGAALASLIGEIIAIPYLYYKVISITNCKLKDFIKTISFPIAGAVVVSSTLFILKEAVFMPVTLTKFVLLTVTGIISYTVVMKFFEKALGYKGFQEIRKIIAKIIGHDLYGNTKNNQ